MTATEMKRTFKIKIWSEEVQNCKSSGLTVKEWCARNQINSVTYFMANVCFCSSVYDGPLPTTSPRISCLGEFGFVLGLKKTPKSSILCIEVSVKDVNKKQ